MLHWISTRPCGMKKQSVQYTSHFSIHSMQAMAICSRNGFSCLNCGTSRVLESWPFRCALSMYLCMVALWLFNKDEVCWHILLTYITYLPLQRGCISLVVYVCVRLAVRVCLSTCLSVTACLSHCCLSVRLCVGLSLYLSVSLTVCISDCLPACLSLPVCLSAHLPVGLSVSICLFVSLNIDNLQNLWDRVL